MSKRDEAVGKLYEAQTKMQEANALIAEANHELQRIGIDRFARELRDLRGELAQTLQATYGYTRMIETTPVPAERDVPPTPEGETEITRCATTGRLNRTAVVRYGHGGKTHLGEATSFDEGKRWQGAANCLARRGDGVCAVVSFRLDAIARISCGHCQKTPLVQNAAAGICPKCGGWTNKCLCDL